jgi:hypothetical protein
MQSHDPVVGASVKREALQRVLGSKTFARCDQLKHFLAYVGELELAGRANEINEYAIGTEALGRSADFVPQDDSTVRTRAYSLRQKLQEYYDKEAPDALLHIELPKGSYCPVFLQASPLVSASAAAGFRRSWLTHLGCAAGGAVLALAVWVLIARQTATSPVEPVIREAWGPFGARDANVALVLSAPPQLHLRSFAESPLGVPRHNPPLLPAPPEVSAFYETFRLTSPGTPVYMWRTNNSMLLGDALAAAIGTRTLSQLGASFELLPEKSAGRVALRGRNIFRFGSPTDTKEVALDLARARYTIRYDPARLEEVITDQPPGRSSPADFVSQRAIGGRSYGLMYGLLTVIPTEGSDRRHRTAIVSGVSSACAHGAMEFFTSAAHLRTLKQRFAAEGHTTFPDAYQVVIRCTVENSTLITYDYEKHAIFQ